jgi:hypothetical protein
MSLRGSIASGPVQPCRVGAAPGLALHRASRCGHAPNQAIGMPNVTPEEAASALAIFPRVFTFLKNLQLVAAKVSKPKFRENSGSSLDFSKVLFQSGMSWFESSKVSQAVPKPEIVTLQGQKNPLLAGFCNSAPVSQLRNWRARRPFREKSPATTANIPVFGRL